MSSRRVDAPFGKDDDALFDSFFPLTAGHGLQDSTTATDSANSQGCLSLDWPAQVQSQRAAAAVAGIFLAVCILGILLGPAGVVTPAGADQRDFHLPVIRMFAQQWPRPVLRDYNSATGPLWHLLLAIPARLGADVTDLRMLQALSGAALVFIVAYIAAWLYGDQRGALLALPAAFNPYVLMGSMWTTTDVPCMAALVATLAAAIFHWRPYPWLLPIGIAIRQTSLYMMPPMLILRWASLPNTKSLPRRAAATLSAAAPSLMVIGLMFWLWGGLCPPTFQARHQSINRAVPAFTLSLIGLWGVPLLGNAISKPPPTDWRGFPMWPIATSGAIIAAAMFGLLTAIAPPTAYDFPTGRWGGCLWSLAHVAPTTNGRSWVFVLLAPLGAATAWLLVTRAVKTTGTIGTALGVALLGLITINTGTHHAYERYADIPLMVFLPWLAAAGVRGAPATSRRRILYGGLLLAGIQATMSIWMVAVPLVTARK